MSPPRPLEPPSGTSATALARVEAAAGTIIHEQRTRRRWTLRRLADAAGLSVSAVHGAEAGRPTSLATYVRIGTALGLRPELTFTDRRRTSAPVLRRGDLVHSAMGDLEARHLARLGYPTGIDEPYQHFQFAGRADLIAWDLERRSLLHVENRTRFPDVQEAAGSWNAKRTYLPAILAQRLGIARGWRSVTHVMVALWSAEVLHVIRLRTATFRALCADPAQPFTDWWAGNPPAAGVSSSLVVLDPLAAGRQAAFADLDGALRARPRHRDYAEAAQRLRRA